MWKYSRKLFWSGVPVSNTRRIVRTPARTARSWFFSFLITCASSITRTSGPGSCSSRRYSASSRSLSCPAASAAARAACAAATAALKAATASPFVPPYASEALPAAAAVWAAARACRSAPSFFAEERTERYVSCTITITPPSLRQRRSACSRCCSSPPPRPSPEWDRLSAPASGNFCQRRFLGLLAAWLPHWSSSHLPNSLSHCVATLLGTSTSAVGGPSATCSRLDV